MAEIKMEAYHNFYTFYSHACSEFYEYLTRDAWFLDMHMDSGLDFLKEEDFIIDPTPPIIDKDFVSVLKENNFSEELVLEIETNTLFSREINELYFTRIFYYGIFRLEIYYWELTERFQKARKLIGDKVFTQKFLDLETLFHLSGFNPVIRMVYDIYSRALESGIKIHSPGSLSEEIKAKNIEVRLPGYVELLSKVKNDHSHITGEGNYPENLSECLGENANKLIPYLKENYANAKPAPLAIVVITMERMGITKGLLNGNISKLHEIYQSEINPKLNRRSFSQALTLNDPEKQPHRNDLVLKIQSIEKVIQKVIDS